MRTLLVGLLVCCASMAQTVRLQRVVSRLAQPTDIQSPVDGTGRLFILEQAGRIRIVKNGSLIETPFLDIRSRVGCCGERGLLGLAFPPGFAQKHYFYVNYTDTSGDTVVSRFRVPGNPDAADPGSEQVLLRIDQPFANHNGGGLVFGAKDGFLYIGMGDGGSAGDPNNNGQRTDTLLGKMLRIDTESVGSPYAIPPSNPFVNRSGFRPEIWATGLRNPWRYAFDRETGDLWIADVGQNRAEEVNFQPGSSTGGENYGWNRMEGLQCFPLNSSCDRNGLTMPVLEYPRSAGCSVTGGKVYRGSRWPELQGLFLYADYCTGNLWAVRRGSEPQLLLAGSRQSFSSFGEGENGELYIADQASGSIYLITAGGPALTAAGVVNAASFGAGISPGSLATVFGTGITSFGGIVAPSSFPLPTELAGTSVTMNGIAAPLIGLASTGGQEQINFQVPYQLAGQTAATVVVTLNGQAGSPVQFAPLTDFEEPARSLLEHWQDGRVKIYLTERALAFRKGNADLFRHGAYVPLPAAGKRAANVFAFIRRLENRQVVVAVPRMVSRLATVERFPIGITAWRDTQLVMPEGGPTWFKNILTGERVTVEGGGLPLHRVLGQFPVGLLAAG